MGRRALTWVAGSETACLLFYMSFHSLLRSGGQPGSLLTLCGFFCVLVNHFWLWIDCFTKCFRRLAVSNASSLWDVSRSQPVALPMGRRFGVFSVVPGYFGHTIAKWGLYNSAKFGTAPIGGNSAIVVVLLLLPATEVECRTIGGQCGQFVCEGPGTTCPAGGQNR